MNTPRKQKSSKHPPLFHEDDEAWVHELIKELINRKYFVTRPSMHQLKHRKVSFYPSTDTIIIDSGGRYEKTGAQAFLDLLEQMYPKKRGQQTGSPPSDDAASKPPAQMIDLRLALESVGCVANDNTSPNNDAPF